MVYCDHPDKIRCAVQCSAVSRAPVSQRPGVIAWIGCPYRLKYFLRVKLQMTCTPHENNNCPVTILGLANMCSIKVLLCCMDSDKHFYAVFEAGTQDDVGSSSHWCTGCHFGWTHAPAEGCIANGAHTNHYAQHSCNILHGQMQAGLNMGMSHAWHACAVHFTAVHQQYTSSNIRCYNNASEARHKDNHKTPPDTPRNTSHTVCMAV